MINADIQEIGNKIKNRDEVITSTQMDRSTREAGQEIRKKAKANTATKTEIVTKGNGRTTEGKALDK